jgi:hypothetical protein
VQLGGVSLASSRNTQSGPDATDVASALDHFQKELGGPIELLVTLKGRGKFSSLTVVATLYQDELERQVRRPWVSASVNSKAYAGGDFSQVLLSSLYELDKECYRQEVGISPIRR